MTSPQSRPAGIIANPQSQVVLQSPQAQQQLAANKLTSAANSLLQLQQQQQLILANATPVVNLCNSIQSQNFINNNTTNGFKLCSVDNTENCIQQAAATGPFKVYSELKTSPTLVPGFCISIKHTPPQMWTSNEHFSCCGISILIRNFLRSSHIIFNRQPRHFNLRQLSRDVFGIEWFIRS